MESSQSGGPLNSEPPEEESSLSADGKEHPTRRGLLVFCPHRTADTVIEIRPEDLIARGIKGVILDLDNTLVRWSSEELTEEIIAWLQSLREAGLKFCLLSNSVISRRVDRVAARVNCPNIRKARKPSRGGFHRAMVTMDTTPSTTAIIGDQMFTDIWGGNRVGVYTIMVKPITPREFPYTRFVSRPPERLLLKWFRRRGHL